MTELLADSPINQLAFSMHENPGVYALLVGSGLSSAAGIPTGWDITCDLIRRVLELDGHDIPADSGNEWLATKYRNETGGEASYSELLEKLGQTNSTRRSILESYIEPNDQEQRNGPKLPTKLPTDAHRAIARLVRNETVRVIVTTNFDRLLEQALQDEGVQPTIVASPDALDGAEPMCHARCWLLKLHGDYKDIRSLNTEEELGPDSDDYKKYKEPLARILDEYGLVVCGWSGEWDIALREAILGSPSRRYPTFWATMGPLCDDARSIVEKRKAKVVKIRDANSFFGKLACNVETLKRTRQSNPADIGFLMGQVKRLLDNPARRIELDELITAETQRLLNKVGGEEFSNESEVSEDEFRYRVSRYEAATEAMAGICGILGRWGSDLHISQVRNVVGILRDNALMNKGEKTEVWDQLNFYPAVLVSTGYGLGLVQEKRWPVLHRFLSEHFLHYWGRREWIPDQQYRLASGEMPKWWKRLPEQGNGAPIADHLCDLYGNWSKSFAGPVPAFDLLFEIWDTLCAVVFFERFDIGDGLYFGPNDGEIILSDEALRKIKPLSAWRYSLTLKRQKGILDELDSGKMKVELVEAGFGRGKHRFFSTLIEFCRQM